MTKHLIIIVHGIQSLGHWQPTLRKAILAVEPTATVHLHKYGVVSFASLIPWRRRAMAARFAGELLAELERERWDRIEIVAHSFGTYVVTEALEHLVASNALEHLPKIDTLIFASSVLPQQYPWRDLIPRYVCRLVNDCGVVDNVLLLPRLIFPKKLGCGGRLGFEGMTSHDMHNRRFLFGHHGYFDEKGSESKADFMSKWWVPLLTQDMKVVPEHDAILERPFSAFTSWFERQLDAIRISIWLMCLLAILTPVSISYFTLKSLNRQLLAESWALRSLLKRNTSSVEAKQLAIASATLERTPQSTHALLAALKGSAKSIATFPMAAGMGQSEFALDGTGTTLAEASVISSSKLQVRLYSLDPKMGERGQPRSFSLPDQGCSQGRGPVKLHFSNTGQYLSLETLVGSCILDTRSLRWVWDAQDYEEVAFSFDDSVFYAARAKASLTSGPVKTPILSMFSSAAAKPVPGILETGWISAMAPLGISGLVASDSIGRTWVLSTDGLAAAELRLEEGIQVVVGSRDGQRLAAGTEAGAVVVVSTKGRNILWRQTMKSPPIKLQYSKDGSRLAALLSDGTVRVWDADKGTQIAIFDGGGFSLDLRFLGENGDRLLTVNRGTDIKVWNVPAQSLAVNVPIAVTQDRYAFDNEGDAVIAIQDDGNVTLWDTTWQGNGTAFHVDQGVSSAVARGNGKFVAAQGFDQQLRVWDTESGQALLNIPRPHANSDAFGSQIDLSEDGSTLARVDKSNGAEVWRSGKGRVFSLRLPNIFSDTTVNDNTNPSIVRNLPLDTDPRIFSNCSVNATVNLEKRAAPTLSLPAALRRTCRSFEPRKAEPANTMSTDPWEYGVYPTLSADGSLLALAFLDEALVFDVATGQLLHRFPQGYVESDAPLANFRGQFGPAVIGWMAFSNGNRHLLVGTREDSFHSAGRPVVRSWPLGAHSAEPRTLTFEKNQVNFGYLSNTNSIVSWSQANGKLSLWDAESLQLQNAVPFERFIDTVSNSHLTRDALVVVSHDPNARWPRYPSTPYVYVDVFNPKTLARNEQLKLPMPVSSVALAPNGLELFVEDGAGNAKTMDLKTGRVLAEFELGTKPRELWFRRDGTLFYTSGGQMQYSNALAGDKNIWSINWKTDELVRKLCSSLQPRDRNFPALSEIAGVKLRCE